MKFLAGLVASVMTATMLAFGGLAPAAADHGYSSHIGTNTNAWSLRNPIRRGQRAPFAVRIRAENGASPNAVLSIRVERRYSGRLVWRGTRTYWGGREEYRTGRLPRGQFRVIVRADVNRGRYADSRAVFGQRVTR